MTARPHGRSTSTMTAAHCYDKSTNTMTARPHGRSTSTTSRKLHGESTNLTAARPHDESTSTTNRQSHSETTSTTDRQLHGESTSTTSARLHGQPVNATSASDFVYDFNPITCIVSTRGWQRLCMWFTPSHASYRQGNSNGFVCHRVTHIVSLGGTTTIRLWRMEVTSDFDEQGIWGDFWGQFWVVQGVISGGMVDIPFPVTFILCPIT